MRLQMQMIRLSLPVVLGLTASTALAGGPPQCPTLNIGNTFAVDQQAYAVNTTMKIKSLQPLPGQQNWFGEQKFDEVVVGRIEKKLQPFSVNLDTRQVSFHPTDTFKLLDANGRLIAMASKALIRIGGRMIITDCNGQKIGEIREDLPDLMQNMMVRAMAGSSVQTGYGIYDAQNNQILRSQKLDFGIPQFNLTDANGSPVVQLHVEVPRGIRQTVAPFKFWPFLRDKWIVNSNGSVDPRLYIFVAAFKTDSDDHHHGGSQVSAGQAIMINQAVGQSQMQMQVQSH